MQVINVPLERLSAKEFAPFGWILEGTGEADYARPGLENWRLPFVSLDPLRLQVMRYSNAHMRLSLFERHVSVTEARQPLGNAAAVLVVAGDPSQDARPEASSVRAFLLDGQGIMFRKGVWHGLDCFPARSAQVDYLFLSDAATEDEIEGQSSPSDGIHTQLCDFALQGITFQITDPEELI